MELIAAGMEATAYYDHPARWLVAGMADLSILIFSVLISLKGGLPEGYAPTSLRAALITQAILLVIYVAGTAARTLVRDRSITSGEIAQTALAFLIGLGGALQTSKGDIRATFAVALFALAAGSACYVISSVFLGRERNRNFYVYATVAWLCVLAGSFPLFSGLALVAAWSAFALACCWAGLRAKQHAHGLHGAVLLLLTSLVSGVVPQSTAQLFGAGDASPWSPAGVVVVAAFLSYVVVAGISPGRVSALVISATLAWGVAGLAARGLVLAWQAFQGGHGKGFPTATFGTAALMFLTTAMAWSGSTWRRPELIWLVYAFMTVAGCKLLMLDLRLTNTLPLVISLLLYGGTLMLLPRILQSGRTSQSSGSRVK